MPQQWIKDVKVAKTKVKQDNVIFSEEVKRKSGQRMKFHLSQMASLVQNVGEATALEEYQEVKKELVETVIDKTVNLIMKDVRLDVRQVPQISLDRTIPYCVPPSDDRDDLRDVDCDFVPGAVSAAMRPQKMANGLDEFADKLLHGALNRYERDPNSIAKVTCLGDIDNPATKEDIEKEIRKLEYKDYEDFKNSTGIHGKTNQIKDPDFQKRSAASKKGWETRLKNADKK